jgi:hypothetical protein
VASILTDKSSKPDDKALAAVLGASFKNWAAIKASVQKTHGTASEEWKYYGAKSGWVLKYLLKTRNLFFLIPREKHFTVGFVFGDKAVGAIERSTLPQAIVREVRDARKYAEGRGLRIDVKNNNAVKQVLTLVDIKVHS